MYLSHKVQMMGLKKDRFAALQMLHLALFDRG